MLLTKECDYGLRIIRTLADNKKKTVEQICETELIPGQYAYKILKKLEKAGFLQSIRGRNGGYFLAKSLNEFTIYDVITAVDENLFILECLREGTMCRRNTEEAPCAVHREFARIQNMLKDALSAKTMQELL